jgi:hypothetical protein
MADIYEFLQRHNITYEKCEHPAVFTTEEAERLVPPLPGAHAKNRITQIFVPKISGCRIQDCTSQRLSKIVVIEHIFGRCPH